ncbi:MAG: MATE family efflux transporter [Myxococcota bacterium]
MSRSTAHPFESHPHRTFFRLTLPVMASLVVEPLAGVVDTAFVERLGVAPAAALGAATALLSSSLWLFNFLGIGTQTEVARGSGVGDLPRARQGASLALVLSLIIAIAYAAALALAAEPLAAFMSEDLRVQGDTVTYLHIRLLGAPAMLVTLAAFGALRGLQDMRTPLWVAAIITALNVVLDPILIFGWGGVPALGIAGAAWATVASQLLGMGLALLAVRSRLGLVSRLDWRRSRALLRVGRDMIVRTGALLLFLLLATRTALQAGAEAGAAQQALRQVWILLAFLLDAYATAGQTLIGYFRGAERLDAARHVARVACIWGLASGLALVGVLLAVENPVMALLVPPSAASWFHSAWLFCALAQPMNALSFVTDGIHWGTGDYAYLRNAMLASTAIGLGGLALIDPASPDALLQVWLVTGAWTTSRAIFGLARIPYGPLRRSSL